MAVVGLNVEPVDKESYRLRGSLGHFLGPYHSRVLGYQIPRYDVSLYSTSVRSSCIVLRGTEVSGESCTPLLLFILSTWIEDDNLILMLPSSITISFP